MAKVRKQKFLNNASIIRVANRHGVATHAAQAGVCVHGRVGLRFWAKSLSTGGMGNPGSSYGQKVKQVV